VNILQFLTDVPDVPANAIEIARLPERAWRAAEFAQRQASLRFEVSKNVRKALRRGIEQ
jgi:hypothetical protein